MAIRSKREQWKRSISIPTAYDRTCRGPSMRGDKNDTEVFFSCLYPRSWFDRTTPEARTSPHRSRAGFPPVVSRAILLPFRVHVATFSPQC
eukprot:1072811-Prymnesium_polylepis.1